MIMKIYDAKIQEKIEMETAHSRTVSLPHRSAVVRQWIPSAVARMIHPLGRGDIKIAAAAQYRCQQSKKNNSQNHGWIKG
jgi:hypothetical protein